MICGVPRSGTTLLCSVLRATGLAGRPVEYFDPGKMKDFARAWKTGSVEEFVETMLARTPTPNGVFGIKAHFGQMQHALGDRDPSEVFPHLRFVYVTRRDRVRQAVSWSRAAQTGEWSTRHEAKRGPAAFDVDDISFRLGRIEELEQLWERFFAEKDISPLRLVYEEFSSAPEETAVEVMEFVGIELPPGFAPPAPNVSPQTDDISEEWVKRFREIAAAEVDSPSR